MERYQVTGNEYLSLPTIREKDGGVEGISFLSMGAKGMLEIRGDSSGLMLPEVALDGEKLPLAPQWERTHAWIPRFVSEREGVRFSCIYLTPIGERAMGIRLEAKNLRDAPARLTLRLSGRWEKTLHEINETLELTGERHAEPSGWNHMFLFSQRAGLPLFALAPCIGDSQPFSEMDQGAQWQQNGFHYEISKEEQVEPGKSIQLDLFWGVGYEGVAAATSAKELLRQGFDSLYQKTAAWLEAREKRGRDQRLTALLNENLFFAFFFASGRTIDTEELCMMTSRSPRYYVSAAYWDRDSLLWAFPAILSADLEYAGELLRAVFARQKRNFGVHSRYIDGTVLEPGFELDELCAPVIALERYLEAGGSEELLHETSVTDALRLILKRLEEHKNPSVALYDTFLQPTDDLRRYPYLTYDNALVWKALRALARLLNRPELTAQADAVRGAIYEHCVREQAGKRFFAWSVDLQGQYDIYDEPPGSLQLLPFYGLCSMEDPVWQTTAAMIRDESYELSFAGKPIAEIGCKHAPHPWILSICNSLLSGHRETALAHLSRTEMDNGLACESINENTGACETGQAFATCAGFLAYALEKAGHCPY
ncbi:MAG: glycoside hydrolase family 125 protein [Eubacteriales bacterium]|nr:glycoside hydrolase family 125 protein [Eubacteriales bacterium]